MARVPKVSALARRGVGAARAGLAEAGLADSGSGNELLVKAMIVATIAGRLRDLAVAADRRDAEEIRSLTRLSRLAAAGDTDAADLLARLREASPHAAQQLGRIGPRRT